GDLQQQRRAVAVRVEHGPLGGGAARRGGVLGVPVGADRADPVRPADGVPLGAREVRPAVRVPGGAARGRAGAGAAGGVLPAAGGPRPGRGGGGGAGGGEGGG